MTLKKIQPGRIDTTSKQKVWDFSSATILVDTPLLDHEASTKKYVDDMFSGGVLEIDPYFSAWLATDPLADFLTEEVDPVFGEWLASVSPTNWDTAYGWGDHAQAGYLLSETDPIFSNSPAYGIGAQDIIDWDAAFGWGDHAGAGYLTTVSGQSHSLLADLDSDDHDQYFNINGRTLGQILFGGLVSMEDIKFHSNPDKDGMIWFGDNIGINEEDGDFYFNRAMAATALIPIVSSPYFRMTGSVWKTDTAQAKDLQWNWGVESVSSATPYSLLKFRTIDYLGNLTDVLTMRSTYLLNNTNNLYSQYVRGGFLSTDNLYLIANPTLGTGSGAVYVSGDSSSNGAKFTNGYAQMRALGIGVAPDPTNYLFYLKAPVTAAMRFEAGTGYALNTYARNGVVIGYEGLGYTLENTLGLATYANIRAAITIGSSSITQLYFGHNEQGSHIYSQYSNSGLNFSIGLDPATFATDPPTGKFHILDVREASVSRDMIFGKFKYGQNTSNYMRFVDYAGTTKYKVDQHGIPSQQHVTGIQSVSNAPVLIHSLPLSSFRDYDVEVNMIALLASAGGNARIKLKGLFAKRTSGDPVQIGSSEIDSTLDIDPATFTLPYFVINGANVEVWVQGTAAGTWYYYSWLTYKVQA